MTPVPRTLRIKDARGVTIAAQPAKSTAAHYSIRGPADQRQLDAMYVPAAVTGEIAVMREAGSVTIVTFKFDAAGKSQYVMEGA